MSTIVCRSSGHSSSILGLPAPVLVPQEAKISAEISGNFSFSSSTFLFLFMREVLEFAAIDFFRRNCDSRCFFSFNFLFKLRHSSVVANPVCFRTSILAIFSFTLLMSFNMRSCAGPGRSLKANALLPLSHYFRNLRADFLIFFDFHEMCKNGTTRS